MAILPDPIFMRRAIDLASGNVKAAGGGPFAAVIVKDGIIIAEAANSVTTTNDPTAHGEINAIRKACGALGTFSLEGCDIYSSCEPCPMCLAAIYWARIDRIMFGSDCKAAARAGFDDAFLYKEMKVDHGERKIPVRQMMADEAWASFQLWLDTTSRVDY